MYVLALIFNTKNSKWHPVIFRYTAPPSGDLNSGGRRFKSAGHHTEGFASLEEAQAFNISAAVQMQEKGDANYSCEAIFEWDGNGLPTIVCWFIDFDDLKHTCRLGF